jgi:hypothetical protein
MQALLAGVPEWAWWAGFIASQVGLTGLAAYQYRQAVYWHGQWQRVCAGIHRRKLLAETIVAPRFHAPRTSTDRHSCPTIEVTEADLRSLTGVSAWPASTKARV